MISDFHAVSTVIVPIHPDALVCADLDVSLPDMDGFSLQQALAEQCEEGFSSLIYPFAACLLEMLPGFEYKF